MNEIEAEILEEVVKNNPEIGILIDRSKFLLTTALEMINIKLAERKIFFRYLSQKVDILEDAPSPKEIH